MHACETEPVYTIVEDEWQNDVRVKVNSCREEIWAVTNEGEPWALIPGSYSDVEANECCELGVQTGDPDHPLLAAC